MLEVSLTLGTILSYFVGTYLTSRTLEQLGKKKNAAPKRAIYISKVFNLGLLLLGLFALCIVWGVDYGNLLVAATSTLAVIGVALFAQWSILSNITASIVIFFTYPTRIGDSIRVLDTETTTVEGQIQDISLFRVLIRARNGDLINYPNNLIIQKPVVKVLGSPSSTGDTEPHENVGKH